MIAVQFAVLAACALTFQSVYGAPDKTALFGADFIAADTNHDGKISKEELSAILKRYDSGLTDAVVEEFFKEIDTDNNGEINFEEYVAFAEGGGVEALFRVYDGDKNGFLTEEELQNVLTKNGAKTSPEEVSRLIKIADTDGDGMISLEEFKALLNASK